MQKTRITERLAVALAAPVTGRSTDMAKATKIVRRPDFAGGGVTPDELHRMEEHASSWISNAMRTDTVDRQRLTQAVKDLYRVSGRAEPIVVIVPSPRIMAFAG